MSAESETNVGATPLLVLEPAGPAGPSGPVRVAAEAAAQERRARASQRAEEAARWKAIQDAGGATAWIDAELRAKGVLVTADPATLSDTDKANFKEKKAAEARERRALRKMVTQAYRATHVAFVGTGIFFRDDNRETSAERDSRLARAKAHDLVEFDSIEGFAKGLGVSIPALRWLCFHREVQPTSHYRTWTIPKHDGTPRPITAPKRELKAAQRWLLRNIVEKLPVHRAAHGFLASRSIATNATVHAGADVIVKIDVKDFFPTISFRRVKGLLRKAGLPENVATLASLLATECPRDLVSFRGKTLYVAKGPRALPQGAPTSPGITNAICIRLDRRMSGLARLFGFSYTRYADDLTFSFRGAPGHPRINAPIGALLRGANAILKSEGFRLNAKKTTVMRGGSSQRITGLVVNRAPEGTPPARVPRDVVRRLKAAIFNREHNRPGQGTETVQQLKGLAAFVHMVDPVRGRAFLDRLEALEER